MSIFYICISLLTLSFSAPFGYQIKIEFRDQFHLEDATNCEYDFLEVRDGAFGYSTSIDKLCGPDFPRDIVSSDRFLFLRFVSDDSIQYSGFRAVYSFIQNQSKLWTCVATSLTLLFLSSLQMKDPSHQVVSVFEQHFNRITFKHYTFPYCRMSVQ